MSFFDLHCDTIGRIYQENKKGNKMELSRSNLQIDIEKLVHVDYYAQCFAMFVHYTEDNPLETCLEMIDLFYQEIEKNTNVKIAYTYQDLLSNHSNKKISTILTIEEGGVCKSNLSFLRNFYRLGVRMICLNWNYENGVGHPNYGKYYNGIPDFVTPNTVNGLTDFGKSMVKEMNRLGMIVDVSHLSDRGFWDVINITNKPIVASHSNARSVCHHVRNLTDDMIVALSKNGGIMGMNYCAAFLDDNEEQGKNTIDCVIAHMKYIKNLVGVDVLALGSDFDGIP